MSAGLIFIESRDPISQIAKRTSRQVYSSMGVFYTNYLADKPTIEVCMAKMYGAGDPLHGTTLEHYKNHPMVTKIALSPVNDAYRSAFLSSFASLRSSLTVPKNDEWLDLFLGIGSDLDLSYKNTGVGFVNRIIKKMGLVSKFNKSNASSLDYEAEEETDDYFKNDIVIAYMKAFKSQVPAGEGNFLLCSYLQPNDVFMPLKEVEITPRDPEQLKLQVNAYMQKYHQQIASVTETFITKLSNNSIYNYEFVKTVINSFRSVQEEQKRARKILEIALEKLMEANSNMPDLMLNRHLSWDKLMEVSKEYLETSDAINMLLRKPVTAKTVNKPVLSYDIHVDVDGKPSPMQIFLDSLSSFVRKTNQSLRGADKEIHWGELVTDLNTVLMQAGMETLDIPNMHPVDALVTFYTSSEINLELITGRHVTITNQKGDEKQLNQLTAEELHNLNCILDVMAGHDYRLDHVRSYITKLLSKK